MSQSLSKIYLHVIFHVKNESPLIRKQDLPRIHEYIGGVINNVGCQTLKIGGTSNHVHCVFVLSKNENTAHVVEEIKRNSSRWVKTISPISYKCFAWQGGYAAFSVSQSIVNDTIEYVSNQEEHHRNRTYMEELTSFLKLYGIEYDEQYLWRD